MESRWVDDDVLRRYLLGQLSKADETRCEEQYFAEDALFELLLVVESELIDAYARGELPEPDRERFERCFLTVPGRRLRVAFARALQERLSSTAEPPAAEGRDAGSGWRALLAHLRGQTAALRLSLAGALLLLALLGSWLVLQLTQVRSEQDRARAALAEGEQRQLDRQRQAAEERARFDEGAAGLERERLERSPEVGSGPEERRGRRTVSLLLAAGLVRGGGAHSHLKIPADADWVRLELPLQTADFPSYLAVLQTASGVEVGRRSALEPERLPSGEAVVWVLAARLLAGGDYVVLLQGTTAAGHPEDVAEYSFRAVRK